MAEYEVGAGISVGSRMFKGGGHALRVPALDIAEVGAGGGSLSGWTPAAGCGSGPESAGAVPGPVCYGLGNEQPTLTDANLVLGYLNQTHLLGGALPIDGAAAHRALRERVAEPLGLDLLEAAYGVHRIAVSNMVRVARAVSTERGRDPRRCVLVAFGGNGPVHAAEVARQLGIGDVVVPPWPGLFSAFGLLAAETAPRVVAGPPGAAGGAARRPTCRPASVRSSRSARAALRERGPRGRRHRGRAVARPALPRAVVGAAGAGRTGCDSRTTARPSSRRFEREHERDLRPPRRPERGRVGRAPGGRARGRIQCQPPQVEPRPAAAPADAGRRTSGRSTARCDTPVVGARRPGRNAACRAR